MRPSSCVQCLNIIYCVYELSHSPSEHTQSLPQYPRQTRHNKSSYTDVKPVRSYRTQPTPRQTSVCRFPYNHRWPPLAPTRPLAVLLQVSPARVDTERERHDRRRDRDLEAVDVARAADDAAVRGRDPAPRPERERRRGGYCARACGSGERGSRGERGGEERAVGCGEIVAGVVRVEVAAEHDGEDVPAEERRDGDEAVILREVRCFVRVRGQGIGACIKMGAGDTHRGRTSR